MVSIKQRFYLKSIAKNISSSKQLDKKEAAK